MIRQEGPGWRLARDPSREVFSVMIGGESWAIELTEYEWSSLASLVRDLTEQHHELEDRLMPEESLSLDIERPPWAGSLDGNKYEWSLRLVLQGDGSSSRGAEFHWPVPAAQAMVSAMRTIWD